MPTAIYVCTRERCRDTLCFSLLALSLSPRPPLPSLWSSRRWFSFISLPDPVRSLTCWCEEEEQTLWVWPGWPLKRLKSRRTGVKRAKSHIICCISEMYISLNALWPSSGEKEMDLPIEFWTSPQHQRPLFQFSVVHKKIQAYETKVSVVCQNKNTFFCTKKKKHILFFFTYTSAQVRLIACNEEDKRGGHTSQQQMS